MNKEELVRTLTNIDTRLHSPDTRMTNVEKCLTSLDKTAPGTNEQVARVEGIVSGMSHGLSRLTWTVNLWGGVIKDRLAA